MWSLRAPFIGTHMSWAYPAVTAFVLYLSTSCLLRAAFSDPGIIPRASKTEGYAQQPVLDVTTALLPTSDNVTQQSVADVRISAGERDEERGDARGSINAMSTRPQSDVNSEMPPPTFVRISV